MAVPIGVAPESASGSLYAALMATKTELMGIEKARLVLGDRSKLAKEEGTHTVLTRFGQAESTVVPMEWYRRAREALGEPTDL
jgi:hypothetical protein